MTKVSILGSGELGATVAQKLACADWPGEIVLIDTDAGAARGRALDLLESNPVLRSGTGILASDSLTAVEASHYLILADIGGSNSGGFSVHEGRQILEAVEDLARDAVVLVAAGNPAPLFRLVQSSVKVDRRRVLGTSPEALASAWRRNIGDKLGCSPLDVQALILGAPLGNGPYEVLAGIAGQPVERLLLPAELRSIGAHFSSRSTPGTRTLASAASDVLKSMLLKKGAVRSVYVWADGAYGAKDLFLSVPVILSPRGVGRILELCLEPRQEVTVNRSIDFLARLQR